MNGNGSIDLDECLGISPSITVLSTVGRSSHAFNKQFTATQDVMLHNRQ